MQLRAWGPLAVNSTCKLAPAPKHISSEFKPGLVNILDSDLKASILNPFLGGLVTDHSVFEKIVCNRSMIASLFASGPIKWTRPEWHLIRLSLMPHLVYIRALAAG
jgi:hypothetical protein